MDGTINIVSRRKGEEYMGNYEVLDKRLHELLEISLKACDDLDRSDKEISNYIQSGNCRDMCRLCLNLFNIYIAISDDNLDDKEIDLVNSIVGTHFGKTEFDKIIDKAGIRKGNYDKQVPVILRAFVDADNYEDRSAGGCPLSVTLYDLFATSGVYVMSVDETININEYENVVSYLAAMYKYIKQNLKFGHSDVKKPEELIAAILSDADIDVDKRKFKK